jgi:hypothetical protein
VVLNSVFFQWLDFFLVERYKLGVGFDRSMSNYVWCEYESDCNDLLSASASASASDSGSDSGTVASAVIVSTFATIQGWQQQSSGAELRTQDQVERSNTQTVTLQILIHSFVRYACVNVVWMRCIQHRTVQHLEQPSRDKPKVGPGYRGPTTWRASMDKNWRLVVCRYEWRSESALVALTFQAPLKSLNYRLRRHVLKYTKYNWYNL